MDEIGIGLIGTGFMGKCHAVAYNMVKPIFGDVPTPRLVILCDADAEAARQRASEFGFRDSTADWRRVVAHPEVAVVAIATPNALHKEVALAAIEHGKHVYCEKPMALTLADAAAMAEAAAARGVGTLVGYNYLHNPMVAQARRLIGEAGIGAPLHFRGWFDEDYMADPRLPYSWRCRIAEAGLGALGDMTCHLISIAQYLIGPLSDVLAHTGICHARRPIPGGTAGEYGTVENEDIAMAIVRFAGGATGVLESSRVAWGRKNHLAWEVHGDTGMLSFDQERLNELLYFRADEPKDVHGFKRIYAGPAHPPYERFMPAPGHGLGFNDMKTIEVAHLLRGIAGRETLYPDFQDALSIERAIHGIVDSAGQRRWVSLAP